MSICKKSDIVIVGGVAAGPKAAATVARRLPEARITLFEKGPYISYGSCGLPYFASGDINSFEELTLTSYGIPRDIDFFEQTKGFKVVTCAQVTAIDRDKKLVKVVMTESGETVEHGYDKLVLATGALPDEPTFGVAESPKIRHFTKPDDAVDFRRMAEKGEIGRALIVGGGFIGCELAEATGGMWGIDTTLIEKENQLLPCLLDPEMADIVKREMRRNNVDVLTGFSVERIDLDEDGNPIARVSGRESISVDYVFLCLGVQPNVILAKECGLAIGETGGIAVDRFMRTSDSDIYAGGDCVESVSQVSGRKIHMPMGSLANRHGRVIAENIAGDKTEFPGVTGAFLVKVYDMNIGAVGISEQQAVKSDIEARAAWAAFVDKPDYYPESKSFTLKIVYGEKDGRLLGLQGAGYGDICRRIDVFSSFLQRKATIYDLLDFEHGHAPPYSESLDPLHHLASIAQAQQRGINFASPGLNSEYDNALWLDVRETEEADELPWKPLENSDKLRYINIPLNDLRGNLDRLERGKKIMIICSRGARSYQAAVILKNAGFNDVYIVGGGTQTVLS